MNTADNLKYSDLPKVKAITINKVSDSELQKQQFMQTFNANIEIMEGAALHYVCLQENIPFLQIRSISNHVGERDKTKWKIKEAIENLNAELQILINGLTN
jgi:futalosine hydrolase